MYADRKIAIPAFETRVSPRFDCSVALLIVTIDEEGTPSRRHKLNTSNWAPRKRISALVKLGVDTIICGGIDQYSAASLESAGVTVHGWVAGELEDALAALLQGDLDG